MNKSINENDQIKNRKEKLGELIKNGFDFPNNIRPENNIFDLKKIYSEETKEKLKEINKDVHISGRIMTFRLMGKASFIRIKDSTDIMQCYVSINVIEKKIYEEIKQLDIGDIVSFKGTLFKTKTNELSVNVKCFHFINKSLYPLPNKWEGLKNTEIKYRQRYLDLIVNDESKKKFITRSKVIKYFRLFLDNHNFLEVETPVLNQIPGGAVAKPFSTYHNSLSSEFYLRISPELYLKKLIVGGFEKVYELNKCFRNEGLSINHNPEFTMLEFYQIFIDYKDLMSFTEKMFLFVINKSLGRSYILYNDIRIDFSKTFQQLTMKESILKYNNDFEEKYFNNKNLIKNYMKKNSMPIEECWEIGELIYNIFEKTVEKKLLQPTFITEYPIEVSPLAKRNSDNPSITDRFELFICGKEISNGFSELNDPIDQKKRFKKQIENDKDNDLKYNKDYIKALEYGMPPTAGQGIGIDRFVMLLTNSNSIKDVLLFPCMKKND